MRFSFLIRAIQLGFAGTHRLHAGLRLEAYATLKLLSRGFKTFRTFTGEFELTATKTGQFFALGTQAVNKP